MSCQVVRSILASALLLAVTGCAGSHKPAESADDTDKGWSAASTESAQVSTDPAIHPAAAGDAPAPPAQAVAESAPPPADAVKPTSDLEAAIVSGKALPPPPKTTPAATKHAKAASAKKRAKGKKKAAATGT